MWALTAPTRHFNGSPFFQPGRCPPHCPGPPRVQVPQICLFRRLPCRQGWVGLVRRRPEAARNRSSSLQSVPQRFWGLRSLPLVLFLLLLPLLCSLVLLHSRVHHLEVTSDPSWPAHFAAHTFFGYNIGDLAFLLSKPSFLIETVNGRHRLETFRHSFTPVYLCG